MRTIIAQAATKPEVERRTISFNGAIHTLEAFQPLIAAPDCSPGRSKRRCCFMSVRTEQLDAIAKHRVASRPDRFEPRLQKRRSNRYRYLRKPRAVLKRELANRIT